MRPRKMRHVRRRPPACQEKIPTPRQHAVRRPCRTRLSTEMSFWTRPVLKGQEPSVIADWLRAGHELAKPKMKRAALRRRSEPHASFTRTLAVSTKLQPRIQNRHCKLQESTLSGPARRQKAPHDATRKGATRCRSQSSEISRHPGRSRSDFRDLHGVSSVARTHSYSGRVAGRCFLKTSAREVRLRTWYNRTS